MGKFFTIHRAGKEAIKNFLSVAFFILLIAGVGGAIVWFVAVRPQQDAQPAQQVETTVPPPAPPAEPPKRTQPPPPDPNRERKPWEEEATQPTKDDDAPSDQVNKLF